MGRVRDKKTVLFVCPSLGGGGAEKVLVTLLQSLDRTRFSPQLAVFVYQGQFKHDLPFDVPVHDLRKKRRADFLKLILLLALPVFRKTRPDVVVSFLWYANIISVLACMLSPCKPTLIISEHISTTMAGTHRRLAGKLLLRLLYPKADGIIAVSSGIREELKKTHHLDGKKIRVIHNCIDTIAIEKLKREQINDSTFHASSGSVIVSCGRLTMQKDFPLLINSCALLNGEMDLHLYILGTGEEEGRLRNLIASRKLDGTVTLLGFKTNPYKYMAAADVFVLSSRYEGFGNVITEAMACGTAVIATDCPFGPGEIIEHEVSGLLVPPQDEQALAGAIRRVLTDSGLRARLEYEGVRRAARFDATVTVREYEKIIS